MLRMARKTYTELLKKIDAIRKETITMPVTAMRVKTVRR